MTVLIPLLTGHAVNAIKDGDKSGPASARPGDRRRQHPAAGPDRGQAAGGRQSVARGRIRPAPDLLRPPAAARPGLLRRPADRPADVAGDRRPAGDPLLPRLRPDLHHPEPADDRAGERGDDRAQPAAGADRAGAGALRRLHRLALQPRLPPGPAGGPAADRRADRRGGGERLRDPHRQGLRPRGVPAAPLPARRRPRLRPEHLLDPPAGLLLAADRAAARSSGSPWCCWSAAAR